MKVKIKNLINEVASEYVWGVKNPARIANQYKISSLKLRRLINEEIDKVFKEIQIQKPDIRPAGGNTEPAGGDTAPPGAARRAKITPGDVDDLELDIKNKFTKADEEVLDTAREVGVQDIDPYILGDFERIKNTLYSLMVQKQSEDRAFQSGIPPEE